MEESQKNLILEKIRQILNLMGFSDYFVSSEEMEDFYFFNIFVDDAKLLIGGRGKTMDALQHLIKIMARKEIKDFPSFVLDINNYRKERIKEIEEGLRDVVREVVQNKKSITLDPMPAHERKIIHLKLSTIPDVATESVGEEPERSVIIKPYSI